MDQNARLGKIEKIDIVLQNNRIGLKVVLSLEGGSAGVDDFSNCTWSNNIEAKDGTWDEGDRRENHSSIMTQINRLLLDAKKDSLQKLTGVPIIATFRDRNILQNFRILTEVL